MSSLLLGGLLTATSVSAADDPTLRPGDMLLLKLPGEESFDQPYQLDNNGEILLNEIGRQKLSGLRLSEARAQLKERLQLIYRDLNRFDLVLRERQLSVTVLGYVNRAGSVVLPPQANVQMALNSAGGLAAGAQLDRMQIRRGETLIEFDYKAYLDSGDPTLVPELQPSDVLFVPASPLIGNVKIDFDARTLAATGDGGEEQESLKVFGEVHRPGTFSFKNSDSIIDMLMRAGGVTRYAGIEQIRVITNGEPRPFNMREYLDTGDPALMPLIRHGDLIFVPQQSEQVQSGARTVYVMGEVFRPGAFETKENASFYDILATAGGPTRFAETRQLRILRADGSVQAFDLQAHVDGLSNDGLPDINPGDAILVPEKTDMNEKSWLKIPTQRAIRIIGAVHRPGRYEWADDMGLMDILAHAGGPRQDADTAHIQILHPLTGGRQQVSGFNLKQLLDKGGDINSIPQISAGDTVVVPALPKDPNDNRSQWVRQSSERSIYILGAVKAPGRYAFNSELNFLDILSAAQGPATDADLTAVRITHRHENHVRNSHLNLHLYFETGDDSLLPDVKNEDVIFIPSRDRDWLQRPKEQVVRVLGSVARPGRYNFDDSMTVLDLLAQAGGPLDNALQDRIIIVNRTSGEARARQFDLVEFARSGDFRLLPLLRAGDTIYIPPREQSAWFQFMSTLRDSITVISFAHLLGL
ncbi:MAG: SLBB domain-containing protein [Marinobacterium sp.]|nr:SLBB domain-containing protein [Marinobacterium sp.]